MIGDCICEEIDSVLVHHVPKVSLVAIPFHKDCDDSLE